MKRKAVLLLIVALGCGVCGCGKRASRTFNTTASAQPEMVTVLVARQKVPMGTLVKDPEQHFVAKQFIKGQEPKKALTSFDQVKNQRLNKPLAVEQFVTSEDLVGEAVGFRDLIQPGMRAVAIRIKVEEYHGFILPNSRVDVLLTVIKGDHDSYSRVILQNMLVLAVDSVRERDKPQFTVVITLAATPEQAEQLAEAKGQGELRLILRPFGDDKPTPTEKTKPAAALLATELPAGTRAVAVRVNSKFEGGGFILPGSRVDVLLTTSRGDYDSLSRVFMQNTLVLAVDSFKINDERPTQPPFTEVTLAVPPDEAETLKMARSWGELSLILREGGEAPRIQAVEVQAKVPRSGGFIVPNSLVDVVITSFEDQNAPLSHLLLTNVHVLAIQLLMPRESEEKPPTVPALVTLALTPHQAEKVAAAKEGGMLRLMVRSATEEKIPLPRPHPTDLPRVPAAD